jgi:hypothetical protein
MLRGQKPMNSERNVFQWHFVYHKSHFYRLGVEPWPPRWDVQFIIVCSFLILLRNVIETANKITNPVFPDVSHRQWHDPGGLCFQTCHTVSWYMCRCIFTNASKESRDFPTPFFLKFTNAMRADLVTEFHPNSTVNVGSKDGISFTSRSKVRVSLHWFSQSRVIFVFSTSGRCYPNRMQKCVKLGQNLISLIFCDFRQRRLVVKMVSIGYLETSDTTIQRSVITHKSEDLTVFAAEVWNHAWGKILFAPVNEVWFSLNRISQNPLLPHDTLFLQFSAIPNFMKVRQSVEVADTKWRTDAVLTSRRVPKTVKIRAVEHMNPVVQCCS